MTPSGLDYDDLSSLRVSTPALHGTFDMPGQLRGWNMEAT
jgi:hypothetical protein